MSYLDFLRSVRRVDLRTPNFWAKLKAKEPDDSNEVFNTFLELSNTELVNSWSYIFDALLSLDSWSNSHRAFILKLLSITKKSLLLEPVSSSLYTLGLKCNEQTEWLKSILELDDHLGLLPHLEAGSWQDDFIHIFKEFSYNFSSLSSQEMENFLTSLTHISRLIEATNKVELSNLIGIFLEQVMFVLENRCNTQVVNKLSQEECKNLSMKLFSFCKTCLQFEILEREELLRLAINLKLKPPTILHLFQENVNLTIEELNNLWFWLYYLENSGINTSITQLTNVFFNALHTLFYVTPDPDVEKYLSIYKDFIRSNLIYRRVARNYAHLLEKLIITS